MEGIKILSLKDAIRFRPNEDTLMIRLFNSSASLDDMEEDSPLEHNDYFRGVLSYQFDDIVPAEQILYGGLLFNEGHARRIIQDFKESLSYINYLAVHCYAGVSRSSAVASSLNHAFNLGIKDGNFLRPDFHRPNMHIYNTMIRTAREMGISFDFCKTGDSYFPKLSS